MTYRAWGKNYEDDIFLFDDGLSCYQLRNSLCPSLPSVAALQSTRRDPLIQTQNINDTFLVKKIKNCICIASSYLLF
jgi:hypothetical protein